MFTDELNVLSGKEKDPDTAVNKEGHVDSLQGKERTHHYWFPWKWFNGKLLLITDF